MKTLNIHKRPSENCVQLMWYNLREQNHFLCDKKRIHLKKTTGNSKYPSKLLPRGTGSSSNQNLHWVLWSVLRVLVKPTVNLILPQNWKVAKNSPKDRLEAKLKTLIVLLSSSEEWFCYHTWLFRIKPVGCHCVSLSFGGKKLKWPNCWKSSSFCDSCPLFSSSYSVDVQIYTIFSSFALKLNFLFSCNFTPRPNTTTSTNCRCNRVIYTKYIAQYDTQTNDEK